jgi:scyllo-inositol 2-dehydrogenase (NADP+)
MSGNAVMRIVIVGMGVQGYKRREIAGDEVVAIVDPFNPDADYKSIHDVPPDDYDAVLMCTPDDVKIELATNILGHGKHLLVEKPLLAPANEAIDELRALSKENGVTFYTAYNHRFEPHFVRMKKVIESGELGKIYTVRMCYGNGTARLVRDSAWRDEGAGVLPDLGSHLLDTVLYWFGKPTTPFHIISANRFENRAFDHISFGSNGEPVLQLEIMLVSWRNHFYADVYAENGSAHISSLCKWGPSTFTLRDRKLPAGRPDEDSVTLVQPDPTWALEYEHFKGLCDSGASNIDNDIWINSVLRELANDATGEK